MAVIALVLACLGCTAPTTASRERQRSPDELPAFELRFSYTDEGLFSPGAPGASSEELLYNPTSVAVSDDDEVFVLDSGNHRIVVLTPQGNVVRTFGRRGQGPTDFELSGWSKIALGPDRIAVLEQDQDRVKVVDRSGDFVVQFDLLDPAKRLTSTPDFIIVTVLAPAAGRPQVHVYDWEGNLLRSLSDAFIPVNLSTHGEWYDLNSSTAASLDGEEVVVFLQYWPIAKLEGTGSKYLEFPWAAGDAWRSDRYQPAAESLEAAQRLEGEKPGFPIVWDVEPVAGTRSWALLLNGGVVQFLDEEFNAGKVGRILPAWEGRSFGVFLDIGMSPSGTLLCATDQLGNQLNCYDIVN